MAGRNSKNAEKGAPLPENVNTEKRMCVCLCIPDEPEYRQAFRAQLASLGKWFFWEKGGGDDRRARDAAALWRQLLYEDLEMPCGCGDSQAVLSRRYNDDGILEVTYDGENWIEAPEQDPRFNTPVMPEIPGVDGDTKKCQAANSVGWFVHTQADQLIADAEAWTGITGLVAAIVAIVAALGIIGSGGALTPLILGLVTALLATGESAFDAAMTGQVYNDFICLVYCNTPEDGEYTMDDWQKIKDNIPGKITGIAGTYLYNLVNAMGLAGLKNASRAGGDEDFDCSVCQCGDLNCGFSTNTAQNRNRWVIATTLVNTPVFNLPIGLDKTAGDAPLKALGNQILGADTFFDELCYVTTVNLYTLGRPNGSSVTVAYQLVLGGAWIDAGTQTFANWSAGVAKTFNINKPVRGIKVQSKAANSGQQNFSAVIISDPTP